MATTEEIDRCIEIFKSDLGRLCLLKCTSDYPASLEDTNIKQMALISEKYKVSIGLSDHSMSNLPAIAATVLGAEVIEKHFILDKNLETPDSFFSLDEKDFTNLVKDIRGTKLITNESSLSNLRKDSESHSLWERPSLYFSRNLEKGAIIHGKDLIIRRPSLGIPPYMRTKIIGKRLVKSVSEYEPVKEENFAY